jgi:hypothetical protein
VRADAVRASMWSVTMSDMAAYLGAAGRRASVRPPAGR